VIFGCVTQIGEQSATIARTAFAECGLASDCSRSLRWIGNVDPVSCGACRGRAFALWAADIVIAGGAEGDEQKCPMGSNRVFSGEACRWQAMERYEVDLARVKPLSDGRKKMADQARDETGRLCAGKPPTQPVRQQMRGYFRHEDRAYAYRDLCEKATRFSPACFSQTKIPTGATRRWKKVGDVENKLPPGNGPHTAVTSHK